MNIKASRIKELETLCKNIREEILRVVSKNGGHLSSTLGATEIIVAMHEVFDSKKDPFIFDVSHQSYAHKLLTGRWDKFDTLREFNGLCGYTKPSESEHDYFVAGHSSTSISLGVGAAKAIALKGEQNSRIPVIMIGDGSMTAGMVYEALNELGERKYPMVIILNDNEMSISKPIGAISRILSSAMASPFYQNFKKHTENFVDNFGDGARYIAKRMEESLKLITPGIMFEEMGIDYIGPVDGHNIASLIEILQKAKELKKPVIVHAQTLKGKGYEIAEGKDEKWHGVGPFDLDSGAASKKSSAKSATQIYAEALLHLAKNNDKIVGATAAMPSGTGLSELIELYPNRFWDVAIAEQHAVTSMAALAKEGFKPFCTIYSTFLQRGYDQVIHDTCLMNLPVVFALDRAGIVGEDGETHQGVFDVSFLRAIPNMTLFAPRDEKSFHQAMAFAAQYQFPCSLRYPRGSFTQTSLPESSPFELAKSQLLQSNKGDVLFIGYGNGVGRAYETSKLLEEKISILDLRFIKPLDKEMLRDMATKHNKWFIFSDSAKMGGVGSAILEFFADEKILHVELESFEYEDSFITHGKTKDVEESLGLLPAQLAQKVKALI
ncbi:1-Deoxy-D-xylulose-5-phosphate synthase [Sulfurimonas denitrificans DSM 1251]|uniref:1-deoxy-D-xylulose-5-phosphate synthase n=1 Tax=Sulfurimonas denitrificans (strain ATCC 33889 / DSM 1251) TaxID=326298 RepID=DXS_SULDN|nr:1-deoxy-D-xylulose-5-phosphate synthase [Sulfurimonas denitrificans]Q30TC5.1 RecName: Full=1-deoxy-D-xylulose-5-phosphate synthase; AltName: Full=1-deoxyxylulose-5-phosphate synthase; Short=DXP synthase; Short=DXPS [Sulfurimonas denitrificans DSM 1251]ABB43756.1 1-Deoxy-D-xylulose-5-phosphate synthase [Sulfurimonas denitrificans DSM 1251]MDD3442424.1 1-deoxy-D-xylulose-5-phosphate synthase [Sulfurimonas denitrificans]